jgi:hypothetical protein
MLDSFILKALTVQNGINIFLNDTEDRLVDVAREHLNFLFGLALLGGAGIIAVSIGSTQFGVEHGLDRTPVKEIMTNAGALSFTGAVVLANMVINGLGRAEELYE